MDAHEDHIRRLPALVFLMAVAVVLPTVPGLRLHGLPAVLAVAALIGVTAVAVAVAPWTRPHRRRFPFIPLVTVALVAAAALFTGGGQSPFTPLYALVIAVAAASYPPGRVVLVVAAACAARSGILLVSVPVPAGAVLRLAVELPVLIGVGVLTCVIARRLSDASITASLLPYLSGRTTHAIERARSAQALQTASLQTMVRLAEAVEARDIGTAAHCRRVAAYSTAIAAELGLPAAEIEEIARGALLHDIGKIAVPDAVLLKEGRLTEEEWVSMRRHAQIGYDLLGRLPYLEHARELVYAHHERWDGQGYPRGLRGAQIPLGARVFGLADALDAMSCDRPYRKALPPDAIVEEIRRGAGTQFDPVVVAAFLRTLGPDLTCDVRRRPTPMHDYVPAHVDVRPLRRGAA